MERDQDEAAQGAEDVRAGEMSEAEIDKNLEDSFPASDPPAWTLGSDHNSDNKQQPEPDDLKDDKR
jgi:hypothetical protein